MAKLKRGDIVETHEGKEGGYRFREEAAKTTLREIADLLAVSYTHLDVYKRQEKNPSAVCLAALSTDAVMEQLQVCLDKKIPVVGFDSGVPNAPEGSIYCLLYTSRCV